MNRRSTQVTKHDTRFDGVFSMLVISLLLIMTAWSSSMAMFLIAIITLVALYFLGHLKNRWTIVLVAVVVASATAVMSSF